MAMNDAMRFDERGDTNVEQHSREEMREKSSYHLENNQQQERRFVDRQSSENMSHEEDRLLLLESEEMHNDTYTQALLNSLPTSKPVSCSMQQTQNFSATAELARALSLAQSSTPGIENHKKSLQESL